MKAYDTGYLHGSTNQKQVAGRAYESDKANREYYRGYVDGLKVKHPGQMIVKCEREGTIFPAYPQTYDAVSQYIECPACARRYFRANGQTEWESDRKLKILFDNGSKPRMVE